MTMLITRRLPVGALLAALLALHAAAASAQSMRPVPSGFDDEDKPWEEIAQALPAAPQAANLASFTVGPNTRLAFSVDTASVSVSKDGVVHYTLVAVSPGGAKNVSHEGIRCQSFEMKYYAFGRADGSWGRSRRDQWSEIPSGDPDSAQNALARDFFCAGRSVNGNAMMIVRRLRKIPETKMFD